MIKNIFFIIIFLMILFFRPNIILTFMLGLFPTFLCLILLKREILAMSVGVFNLCGVLPFIVKANQEKVPFEHLFFYLLTFENIMFMYLPAIVGFFFAKYVSKLIVKVIVKHYEKKIVTFKEELEELEKIWGDEIKK